MQLLALLFIGFSLFTAALLVLDNLLLPTDPQRLSSKLAGFVLISSLAIIQWLNLQFIVTPSAGVFSPLYIALLYCVGPSFYFYSRQLLTTKVKFSSWQLAHFIPLCFSFLAPTSLAIPLAFLIGSAYVLWLAKAVYCLRKQRQRFKLELLSLLAFFSIAITVVALGFIWPLLTQLTFILNYSILIGIAFFVATLTLLQFPSITADVAEAAQATYAESTLKNIDRKKVLDQLIQLLEREKLYTHENLDLAMLAEQLNLNSHQLSELINTEYQLGFSHLIRQYRINEAKKLLIDEPNSSVLSIALSVGFNTQSNFYTAFRHIVGMAPGQYRKQYSQ